MNERVIEPGRKPNFNSVFLLALLIVACCLASAWPLAYISCRSETAEIGFPWKWKVIGGCFIEVKPGQWIPLDNYYFKQE